VDPPPAPDDLIAQLDNLPVALWVSGTDQVRTWCNRRWLDLTGRTLREELGDAWMDAVLPDDLPACLSAYREGHRTGTPFEVEYRLRRRDGQTRWVLDTAVPRHDARGVFLGFLGTCLDITARKTDELERQHLLQQAVSANRAKDQFLATLSHELRTPLNAIVGWAHMLRAGKLDESTAQRAIETIDRNARLQTQLISDILDISRIVTGKLRLNVRVVQLLPVLEAALDTVRPSADGKGIRLQAVLDPAAGPVSGDPDRLQQVLWNLLSNAIKFTPRNGQVQVRLLRVASHIEIQVEDTGVGIPADFLPHVFELFRQRDATPSRQHGGLGLGLGLVRHLVELHGGTVEVSSAGEGQGAQFVVKLPVMITVAQEPGAPDRFHPTADDGVTLHSPGLAGIRVLVVDDDADARHLITAVLGERGALVEAVASAEAALAALAAQPVDVLLSDIEMPNVDGYGLMRRIRSLPPEQGGRIPAAALTAYARTEDRMKALLAGFQIHVTKPVQPAELAAVIASLAQRG
jgi:PAS domain S-box-containing protein